MATSKKSDQTSSNPVVHNSVQHSYITTRTHLTLYSAGLYMLYLLIYVSYLHLMSWLVVMLSLLPLVSTQLMLISQMWSVNRLLTYELDPSKTSDLDGTSTIEQHPSVMAVRQWLQTSTPLLILMQLAVLAIFTFGMLIA